jgi:phosphoesterase RecJ-like protein
MNSDITSALKKLLNSSKKIVVVGHKNPDGDAIGSCLALANYLKQKGHQLTVVMPNGFPKFLKWLPESDTILTYTKNTKDVREAINNAEIICTLDFNLLSRTGDLQELLEDASADFVMVDHHLKPDNYAKICYSDVTMCSTSQMVFHLIEALQGFDKINAAIATQLYTGIMTDTGSFKFSSTTATTHRVIAKLIESGANNSNIHRSVYDTKSPDRIKLLGTALNNLCIISEYNTAYITLTQDELDKHNFKKGDTEGFVNYALSIEGIIFAAIFIESKQDNIVKISFRSKGSFSVNEFARKHYSGGGHTNAAGGKSLLSVKETALEFISILQNYKEALNL